MHMADESKTQWYAVRCVIRRCRLAKIAGRPYEERITLWLAGSFDEAIERAEVEAQEYASGIPGRGNRHLGLAQAYRLAATPVDGAELFSLIRVSKRKPTAYLNRFFDTGTERQQHS